MIFLKRILSILGRYCGLWRLIFWLCGLLNGGPILLVFIFHRVRPDDRSTEEFHKRFERGITKSAHAEHIKEIVRYFETISLDQFTQIVTGNSRPSAGRPKALLTYDDSDAEHLTEAFEVLRDRQLPAVAFVPSGFVETGRHFWHVSLTNICNNFTNEHWKQVLDSAPEPCLKDILLRHKDDVATGRHRLRIDLGRYLMEIDYHKRRTLIEDWEALIDSRYNLSIEHMTWPDLRSLRVRDIAVGSHTVNHVRLAEMSPGEQRKELVDSRQLLTDRLDYSIDSICYPEGSYNDETVAACQRVGYVLGFSSDPGVVMYPCTGDAAYRIPRVVTGMGKRDEIIYPIGVVAIMWLLARLRGQEAASQVF